MPLHNRYVVAALDPEGERIAFLSASFEWVKSARDAAIFQSQIDANYFIEENRLNDRDGSKAPELSDLHQVRPLFVNVRIKITSPEYDPDNPDEGISFVGISG